MLYADEDAEKDIVGPLLWDAQSYKVSRGSSLTVL